MPFPTWLCLRSEFELADMFANTCFYPPMGHSLESLRCLRRVLVHWAKSGRRSSDPEIVTGDEDASQVDRTASHGSSFDSPVSVSSTASHWIEGAERFGYKIG